MLRRYWWMLLVMLPIGMVIGFMVAAVITYMMPKKYESSATIEFRPWTTNRIDGERESVPENFSKSELVKLKTRNSMLRVVDTLDLTNRWGLDRESAFRVLTKIVRTENIHGTDLYTIVVRSPNREDARDIAAEVVSAYKEYREELENKASDEVLNELRKVVREQEDKVEELRKVLTIITRNHQNRAIDAVEAQDYADAKREFEAEISLLDQLKIKVITEEITRNSSGGTIVVHDNPVIPYAPVSPNVALNLVSGAVAGVLLSPLLALPLMWWMGRRREV